MAETEYLTTQKALTTAKKAGIKMSLPTLITLCKGRNFGKQLAGKNSRWYVYAGRFRRWLETGD